MTDKAYIVANKEQEIDILSKLELDGIYWNAGEYPTDFIPSEKYDLKFFKFPYALVKNNSIYWSSIDKLKDTEIVYDGRKEEKMYKVTQEFMNELTTWRDDNDLYAKSGAIDAFVDDRNIQNIPEVIGVWWTDSDNPTENNNRLIAIIQWLNGEDVFEVEEPHKFMVRSEHTKSDGDYSYVKVFNSIASPSYFNYATKFDTREEAQEWANSHQVVVEIDGEGNEVE